MRSVLAPALAILFTAAPFGTVAAAEPITVPISTDAEMPIAGDAPFDWSGFYAGIQGGTVIGSDGTMQSTLGAQVGVNAQFEFYLVGAEVAVTGLANDIALGETAHGEVLGRAGLVVSDNVLVYAAGGYGIDLDAPEEGEALLGGGIEIGVNDSVSVRAQYLHSFPDQQGESEDRVTFGASIHF